MTHKKTAPDFAYWAKMSFWTVEQSTALLIGGDPDALLEGGAPASSCPAEWRGRFQNMFRLLDSHIRMSGIGSNLSPTEVLEWALHTGVDAPPGLVDAVRAQGRTLIERRESHSGESAGAPAVVEKSLSERERNTLLKLIMGMAISGYRYDPDAKRSEVPREIADDMAALGLECSDQTVREKLKDARALLPGDWKARSEGKSS